MHMGSHPQKVLDIARLSRGGDNDFVGVALPNYCLFGTSSASPRLVERTLLEYEVQSWRLQRKNVLLEGVCFQDRGQPF